MLVEVTDAKDTRPSSGLDNLLLILSVLAMIATCLSIIGIIPVSILLLGLIISIRTGDISNVKISTRFLQICSLLAAVGFLVAATQAQDEWRRNDLFIPAGVFSAMAVVLSVFWLGPISRQLGNIQGLFRRKSAGNAREKPTKIMDRDGLAQFSVAEELQKWSQLRKEGLISEVEFQAARERILHSS